MKTKIAMTLGAMALSIAGGTAANAGSITQPGETSGIAIGAPLPEGVYFLNTGSYGSFRSIGDDADAFVNIPVIAWSTPWTLFGGRVEAYAAVPEVAVGATRGLFISALYNPALLVGEAWSFGNGWNFSQFVGGYAPVDNELGAAHDAWVFNSRSAITYNADGWNLTAHFIYGTVGGVQSGPYQGYQASPDYINLDLTATKTIGKWEVGAVGFGSWDVGTINTVPHYEKQGQFALGGLVGYNFTGVSLQAYLTHDVWTEGYYNADGSKPYETRFWTRVVVPLWSPPAEPVTYKQ